jgi:hypothetical protein
MCLQCKANYCDDLNNIMYLLLNDCLTVRSKILFKKIKQEKEDMNSNNKWGYMPLGKLTNIPDRFKIPKAILADEPVLNLPKLNSKYEIFCFYKKNNFIK